MKTKDHIKGCLSHNTDDWKTPTKIYEAFMQENYIDCFKYKSDKNELENIYYDKKLFVNPPFSKMKEITEWVIKNSKENIIALLIPSRTDTEYFHKLLKLNPTILMLFTKFNIFPIWNGLTQDQLIEKIKKLKWY